MSGSIQITTLKLQISNKLQLPKSKIPNETSFVLVINDCDLGFICYLVLGIWILYRFGCALLFGFGLLSIVVIPASLS